MALLEPVFRRLYMRIWLAIAACVVLVVLLVGWGWREAQIHSERERLVRMQPREVLVRNPQGDLIGTAEAQPRHNPGQGFEFHVTLTNGEQLVLQFPRGVGVGGGGGGPGLHAPGAGRRMGGGGPPDTPLWLRPPYGFFWLLGFVGLAVALGVYPIVRRLTQRLEALQRGVQRWGDGDLGTRVPVQGRDEVADLAERFNHAAQHIQALMQAQQALLASQKSLLANASHELRSPLARIRMGLALMESQSASNAQTSRAEIARNITELDQLIDEILLASRLDAQESDLGTVEPVDLVGLAAEEAARTGADLQVPPSHASLLVPGVARLLRRLVRNLLENARRYGHGAHEPRQAATPSPAPPDASAEDVLADASVDAPPGVLVRIATETGAQGQPLAVLQVCDRGPGVPEALRQRIFEPFYRLPGASEREGGVGLGLALVKSIAQRHGGSVHCEDRPGGGACFVVRLPLDNEAAAAL